MDESLTEKLLGRGQDYLKRVSVLPPSYRRISHGNDVVIGSRRFKVITGGGHALDQVMLYCAADKLFLSADQVLSKISPNVSVWAVEPDQNSLGEYLASLASLTTTLPYDVMVLPGHGVPFYGLKTRIKQLADHHEDRCRLIAEACREVPQTSKELVPVVFDGVDQDGLEAPLRYPANGPMNLVDCRHPARHVLEILFIGNGEGNKDILG